MSTLGFKHMLKHPELKRIGSSEEGRVDVCQYKGRCLLNFPQKWLLFKSGSRMNCANRRDVCNNNIFHSNKSETG